jgi:hypothetical protein
MSIVGEMTNTYLHYTRLKMIDMILISIRLSSVGVAYSNRT